MSDTQDLIIVKQLPIIYQDLERISAVIDRKVADALALECNADAITEIKKTRAALNKDFTALEKRRKEIKEQIMAPYMELDAVYKRLVSEKFTGADSTLRDRITAHEDSIKADMAAVVKDFWDEYALSLGIADIPYETSGIKVNMSVTVKKYKEQCRDILDQRAADIASIQTMEHSAEIMAEYRKTYNLGVAVTTVSDRHKAAEKEQARLAELQKRTLEILQAEQKVDAVLVPTPAEAAKIADDNTVITVSFTATATKAKLRALRDYMEKEGIKYQ